jgi:hypothetical protein
MARISNTFLVGRSLPAYANAAKPASSRLIADLDIAIQRELAEARSISVREVTSKAAAEAVDEAKFFKRMRANPGRSDAQNQPQCFGE